MNTTVDFGPFLVTYVLPALGTILTVIAGIVAQKAIAYFHLQNEGVLRSAVDGAVQRGLALAQQEVAKAPNGTFAIDVKSPVVAQAADYVLTHEPAAIKALGYTNEGLAEKLAATIAVNITPPEKSIAVPTPPTPPTPVIVANPKVTS